jgi:hypothetical protein
MCFGSKGGNNNSHYTAAPYFLDICRKQIMGSNTLYNFHWWEMFCHNWNNFSQWLQKCRHQSSPKNHVFQWKHGIWNSANTQLHRIWFGGCIRVFFAFHSKSKSKWILLSTMSWDLMVVYFVALPGNQCCVQIFLHWNVFLCSASTGISWLDT